MSRPLAILAAIAPEIPVGIAGCKTALLLVDKSQGRR